MHFENMGNFTKKNVKFKMKIAFLCAFISFVLSMLAAYFNYILHDNRLSYIISCIALPFFFLTVCCVLISSEIREDHWKRYIGIACLAASGFAIKYWIETRRFYDDSKSTTKAVVIYSMQRSSSTALCKMLNNYTQCIGESLKSREFCQKEKYLKNYCNVENPTEMLFKLYDHWEVPVAVKVFPGHMSTEAVKTLLKSPSICIVRLKRDPKDSFCSLQFAKETDDWGTKPWRHKRNRTKEQFVCRNVSKFYAKKVSRWYKLGEGYYDYMLTFKEHIEQPEYQILQISRACGLKRRFY